MTMSMALQVLVISSAMLHQELPSRVLSSEQASFLHVWGLGHFIWHGFLRNSLKSEDPTWQVHIPQRSPIKIFHNDIIRGQFQMMLCRVKQASGSRSIIFHEYGNQAVHMYRYAQGFLSFNLWYFPKRYYLLHVNWGHWRFTAINEGLICKAEGKNNVRHDCTFV